MMAASRNSNRRHDDDHPRQGFAFNADSNKADAHIGQHLRRRSTWWCSRSTLWIMVCIASVGWAPQLSDAQKGYDKEEKPTGLWYGESLRVAWGLGRIYCPNTLTIQTRTKHASLKWHVMNISWCSTKILFPCVVCRLLPAKTVRPKVWHMRGIFWQPIGVPS